VEQETKIGLSLGWFLVSFWGYVYVFYICCT